MNGQPGLWDSVSTGLGIGTSAAGIDRGGMGPDASP
jgi:hypothetical protein